MRARGLVPLLAVPAWHSPGSAQYHPEAFASVR